MKVAKENHPCEAMLREIEGVLHKYSGTLEFSDHCVALSVGEGTFLLKDLDNGAHISSLPRALESERLVVVGN